MRSSSWMPTGGSRLPPPLPVINADRCEQPVYLSHLKTKRFRQLSVPATELGPPRGLEVCGAMFLIQARHGTPLSKKLHGTVIAPSHYPPMFVCKGRDVVANKRLRR